MPGRIPYLPGVCKRKYRLVNMTIIYAENVPNKYKNDITALWDKEKENFPHGLPNDWTKKECIFAIKNIKHYV